MSLLRTHISRLNSDKPMPLGDLVESATYVFVVITAEAFLHSDLSEVDRFMEKLTFLTKELITEKRSFKMKH